MRLRLRIERNALPVTLALWPVTDVKVTMAQLLQLINERFPLEADTWGLEDYSVSIGGYECVHYHEIKAVCKEDDELVIKPLQFADLRARTLTGRDQIAADGRHLLDGVPFGRPALKAPIRPDVTIPPRKKRKLNNVLENGNDDDDDESDDENFATDGSEVEQMSESSSNFDSDSDSDSESDKASSKDESERESPSDDSSDDSSSDSDSGSSEDDSDGETWNGIPNSAPSTPKPKEPSTQANCSSSPRQTASTAGSKRKRATFGAADAANQEEKELRTDANPPYAGKPNTKARNIRRRESKKLKHLKKMNVLPQDATFEALQGWMAAKPNPGSQNPAPIQPLGVPDDALPSPEETGDEPTPDADLEDATVTAKGRTDASAAKRQKGKAAFFEQQRHKMLSAIASGGIDISQKPGIADGPANGFCDFEDSDDEPPVELSSKQTAVADGSADDKANAELVGDAATSMIPPAVARRSKLNLSGSQRLIFGSLGVRVPKTQEQKAELQKKLAGRPVKNATLGGAESAQERELGQSTIPENIKQSAEAESPDAWKEKIHLTAVECCDEGVTLSTPPFPFYQRWDPQQRHNKSRKRINSTYMENGKKKRKRKTQDDEQEYVETYDKYNKDGTGDGLNYDDDDVEDEEEEYWEDGALLDEDFADAEVDEEGDDGFPPLPTNVDELPILLIGDAQANDYITYTELACDEKTEWQPRMVARTAQIKVLPSAGAETEASQVTLQLATRDVKPQVFDDEGNRVYGKFEMPDDDTPADDGTREVDWAELGVVRMVLRLEVALSGAT